MTNPTLNLDLSQELQTFLRLLNRRKLTVCVVAALIFTAVVIGTLLQKPVYRATASIAIDMETPSMLAIYTSRDDATMAQSNYLTYADYYRTQLEIMKSRRIAEIVFRNLDLGKKKQYADSADPVKKLTDQIEVQPVKQTRLVLLRVYNRNPKLALQIANETARVFVEENLQRSTRSEKLNLMKNEYLSLQSKEAELSKRYKPKFPARARIREQMAQLSLAIEQQNTSAFGESATGVVSALDKAGRPNNIWIQNPAHLPRKPVKPNKVLNILLGILFGIVGGVVVAGMEEFMDATIKSSYDITDLFPVNFLGQVPQIEENPEKPMKFAERYQHMLKEDESEIAEAYRAIRTNLLCAPRELDRSAILITSPGSEEGKTTSACNLAAALAQTGVSVLLVDADLRKPNVYRALELPQTPGLSEFLAGKVSFKETVKKTGAAGLSVVTSGAIPKNPSELLGSARMKEFYQTALGAFDFVLIDTAPMIPVTDATILAALTQAVLVVAQSGKTPREAFKRMVGICDGLKAKIVGVILNRVAKADLTGYGYGYEVYRYGMSTEKKKKLPKKGITGLLEAGVSKARHAVAQQRTGRKSK